MGTSKEGMMAHIKKDMNSFCPSTEGAHLRVPTDVTVLFSMTFQGMRDPVTYTGSK